MRIFFVIIFCLLSTIMFSQGFPNTSSSGSPTTLAENKGGFKALVGIVNATYPDTASANLTPIKDYPNSQIAVNDTMYRRNVTATEWIKMGAGAAGTGGIYSGSGTLPSDVVVSMNDHSIQFGDDEYPMFILKNYGGDTTGRVIILQAQDDAAISNTVLTLHSSIGDGYGFELYSQGYGGVNVSIYGDATSEELTYNATYQYFAGEVIDLGSFIGVSGAEINIDGQNDQILYGSNKHIFDGDVQIDKIIINSATDEFAIEDQVMGNILYTTYGFTSLYSYDGFGTSSLQLSGGQTFGLQVAGANSVSISGDANTGIMTLLATRVDIIGGGVKINSLGGNGDGVIAVDNNGVLSWTDDSRGVWGYYQYKTGTAAADPGSGAMRFDNATYSAVTNLYISQTTQAGVDATAFISGLNNGNVLLIQEKGNASRNVVYILSAAPTDNGTWWTIPVTYNTGSGVTFANNTNMTIIVSGVAGTGGGGSGTVNAGTTGQLPYYAAAGNTLTATSLFKTDGIQVGIGNPTFNNFFKTYVRGGTYFKSVGDSTVLTGTIDPAASTTVTGVGTLFLTELQVGDMIQVSGEQRVVNAISTNTSLTVQTAFSNNANDLSPDRIPLPFKVEAPDGLGEYFWVGANGQIGLTNTAIYIGAAPGGTSYSAISRNGSNTIIGANGTSAANFSSAGAVLPLAGGYGWTNTTNPVGTVDTKMAKDGIGIIAIRNSTTAHELRIYNTDATDDEFLSMGWQNQTNIFTIESERSGGAAVIRDIHIIAPNLSYKTATGGAVTFRMPTAAPASNGQQLVGNTDGTTSWGASAGNTPVSYVIAASDETTDITTGTAKVTFRMPHAMTVTAVRASLSNASSSGLPTINIKENGTTILSTNITIDATEKTSTTAVTAPVISDASLADDSEITIDIVVAGTSARGLKVTISGTR